MNSKSDSGCPNFKPNEEIKNILIYRIGQLGDTIVALPAIWAIRRHFPTAHLALLSDTHGNETYVSAQSVFPQDGLFDKWLTYPAKYEGTSLRGMFDLLVELRRNKFDTLVYLAPRRRTPSQVQRDLVFFRMAGIHTFIGHRGFEILSKKDSNKPLVKLQHEADHLLFRLSLTGIPVPDFGCGEMDLKLTSIEREAGRSWMMNHSDNNSGRCLPVGIGPGSKKPSKVWPVENYVELGKILIREFNLFPVVFGGKEDIALANHLIAQWGRGECAAGQMTVRESAAALSYCRVFIGNDSGAMHLAAAVGTTCIVAFSAQFHPGAWYPYGEGHVVLREYVSCEGCMLDECNRGMDCLKAISVKKMVDASFAVLSRFDDIGDYISVHSTSYSLGRFTSGR